MELVYTIEEIKYLNNHFKEFSESDKNIFLTKDILILLDRHPAMKKGFIESYQNGKGLQPGYLTEINVCATLAKLWGLEYDENISKPNLRHQYSGNGQYLQEYGGCQLSDIQLISQNGDITTFEVKEPLSLGGDYDLVIDVEGKLFPKIKKGRNFPESAQKILDSFNKTDSVFNHLGHNIPLANSEYLKDILDAYLGDKRIDYIATYSNDNKLIYFPVSEIYNHIDFKGSEIRTAGKNDVKVYTPNAFKSALLEAECIIKDDIVTIPKKNTTPRVARGTNGRVTGIKINSIFYFPTKDILKEDSDFYYININKGKQKKQGITVHLNLN